MGLDNLIDENGQPRFGIFSEPVENINYREFDYLTYMDKPAGKLARYLDAYQHHFVSVISDKLVLGCAVADAKSAGKGFLYYYDPETREERHYSYLQLLSRNTAIDTRPDRGLSTFSKGGKKMSIEAFPEPRRRHLLVDIPGELSVDAVISEPDGYMPLFFCSRNGYRGFNYTQKATALSVEGSLELGGKKIDMAEAGGLGSYDWTCGYLPGETTWNWAMLSGKTQDGRRVGFNLCAGLNETSFTENCFWLDGKLHKVDLVNFNFNRKDRSRQWRIESFDKQVELHFDPVGTHGEKVNFIISQINFHQYFGKFSGEIRPKEGGGTIKIDGLWGLAEDHMAKM